MKMELELRPSALAQAFYVPSVVIDCGKPRDLVERACGAYLLWASEYESYTPTLTIQGNPEAAKALNRALFSRRCGSI